MTLYGLSLLWSHTGGKDVSYTESYSVAFTIVAFYKFLQPKEEEIFFLSGMISGIRALDFRTLLLSCSYCHFYLVAKGQEKTFYLIHSWLRYKPNPF